MALRPLKLGTAYHGNRMLHHASQDMLDMVKHGMNLVVHMFTHTDMDRNKNVMKDIVRVSEEAGLEVWIDNWGLPGAPGEKSYFLADYPDSHRYYSDGTMVPYRACWNSPDFVQFTKDWIDAVEYIGGKTIFWDEPALGNKVVEDKTYFSCACPRCKKMFEEKYGRPMPVEPDEDTINFGTDSIVNYLTEVTKYAHEKGIVNVVCVMLGTVGMSLEVADRVCAIPYLDNIGSDPYWVGRKNRDPENFNVYDYVYDGTEKNLEVCERFNKDHNIWIQTFGNPLGDEEDVVVATEAAYDAGARTIITWGYYGSDGVDYRAKNPELIWAKTNEAFARVRNFERDRILAENRARHQK